MNFRVHSRLLFLAVLLCLYLGSKSLWSQNPQLLPYQTSLLAGGGSSSATFASGATCPTSGKTMTDAYGDGCLASEVVLSSPKYVTADSSGNVYFSDTGHGLIRRIDASTSIITTVAGGGALAKPTSTVSDTGLTCPSGNGTANDFQGDGCLATEVQLPAPSGVAVSPLTGDVYFADTSTYSIRRIDHATGIIHNVLGYLGSNKPTYGYYANTASINYGITDPLLAASSTYTATSALDAPFGIHFDATGNLYIAEEYKDAILVLNTSSATTTVTGVSIPAGTVAKIQGYRSTTYGAYCPNGISGTTGCNYGVWIPGASANSSLNDAPYDVTVDSSGNVYFANEYNPAVGEITSAGLIYTYAGTQTVPSASSPLTNKRATATSVQFGSNYGIAADANGNIYTSDSVTGWIWRVDAGTQAMWVYAGAASAVCTGGDAYGDGCPYNQTIFPYGTQKTSSGIVVSASTPGTSGLFVSSDGSLLLADTAANLLHKIVTNTNFGTIQPTNPVQTIAVHFPVGDSLASDKLTTNTSNFSLATPACTTNSDTTVDCTIAVTATPSAKGAFSSNLLVTSANGRSANFTLSGNLVLDQKASTTSVTVSTNTTNPVTAVTITATVSNSFNSPNTGNVEFYASNGTTTTDLGPGTLSGGQASISYTFAVGTYSVYAVYAGNLYLYGSTSQPVPLQSVIPAFSITPTLTSTSVAQGQTAVNAFTVTTIGSYTGTVTFACSGLPSNASCSFSPASLTVGATGYSTETLNIVTRGTLSASSQRPDGRAGHHSTLLALLLPGGAVLLFGFRRRRYAAWLSALAVLVVLTASGLSGCQSATTTAALTPSGSYTVTVTATGTPNVVTPSANIAKTATVTLTVTNY